MSEHRKGQRRLVRYHQLEPEYGIDWSRTHLRREELAGRFPRRVHPGPNTAAWWSDEIEAHLEALPRGKGEAA